MLTAKERIGSLWLLQGFCWTSGVPLLLEQITLSPRLGFPPAARRTKDNALMMLGSFFKIFLQEKPWGWVRVVMYHHCVDTVMLIPPLRCERKKLGLPDYLVFLCYLVGCQEKHPWELTLALQYWLARRKWETKTPFGPILQLLCPFHTCLVSIWSAHIPLWTHRKSTADMTAEKWEMWV